MRKYHYFEIMDLKYCPKVFREVMTDTLSTLTKHAPIFDRIVPVILEVMDKSDTNEIYDLCSGTGGPWEKLFSQLKKERNNVLLTFTDLYPNTKCLEKFPDDMLPYIKYETEPVNALDVKKDFKGVRTFFGSFHHMSPKNAVKVLEDAAKKKVGIVVAESYSHSPKHLWSTLPLQIIKAPLLFLFLWLLMAMNMKGTPSEIVTKIIFTYLIPVIPLAMIFDTFISGARVYMQHDLDEMIKHIDEKGYKFETGTFSKKEGKSAISYVVGYPVK